MLPKNQTKTTNKTNKTNQTNEPSKQNPQKNPKNVNRVSFMLYVVIITFLLTLQEYKEIDCKSKFHSSVCTDWFIPSQDFYSLEILHTAGKLQML